MYYFAYGSNLNKEQMHRRCPAAKAVGRMTLPNARLVFRGVADVEFAEGESVIGGLWKITKACEAALDRYEGVKGGLYRKEYIKIQVGKEQPRKCLVYVMNREHYGEPTPFYAAVIREGYRDFGIARSRLAASIEATRELAAAETASLWRPRGKAKVTVLEDDPEWNPPSPWGEQADRGKRSSPGRDAVERFRDWTK